MVTAYAALAARLPGLAAETSALVERLRRSVVLVQDGRRGSGSGVIWSEDGLIVTNYHVTPGGEAQVVLADGRSLRAGVRLTDPAHDLAVLEVAAAGLPAVSAGDSDRLRVGELVFAVGNPFGLTGAVNTGIITAAPGSGDDGHNSRGMVQADVSLAPGNSGGLLATADGRVVGINSMVRAPGLALAVPSNRVRDLLARESGGRAYLGLSLLEAELPRGWSSAATTRTGLLVTGVAAGSPAQDAGVILGDILISAAGRSLDSHSSLSHVLVGLRPGVELELTLMRGGRPLTATLRVGEALAEAA